MQSETEKRERKGQTFWGGKKYKDGGRREDKSNDRHTGINAEEKNGSTKTEREEKDSQSGGDKQIYKQKISQRKYK